MSAQNTGGGPRIVAGVDGSSSSRAALRWAVRQARLTGGTVDVEHHDVQPELRQQPYGRGLAGREPAVLPPEAPDLCAGHRQLRPDS